MQFDEAREQMVREQLEARGVRGTRVLAAMRRVPRHAFVPGVRAEDAYADRPLPIGSRQTISQPLMVALMTGALQLEGPERTLEIGTGSGYQTAVLAELCAEVVSVERHACLADAARLRLAALGYRSVTVETGDGTGGWPPRAPYDRILVTAGAPHAPTALLDQLARGGVLVIPIGDRTEQELVAIHRTAGGSLRTVQHGACTFVPLIGRDGWQPAPTTDW